MTNVDSSSEDDVASDKQVEEAGSDFSALDEDGGFVFLQRQATQRTRGGEYGWVDGWTTCFRELMREDRR